MAVQPVPSHHHRVNIHLTFKDATKAIAFYQKAFGFEQLALMPGPNGQGVMHAEIRLADTTLFLGDDVMSSGKTVEAGHAEAFVPHLSVADASAVWERAIDAGCKAFMPLAEQFWGDRYGQVVDPFGLRWAVIQHLEDLTPEQIQERMAKEFGGG